MAQKTQGTRMYTIDPANEQVVEVGCVTSISGVDTTNEQIEKTCLSDQARQYEAGLATPGTAEFGINFDNADTSHVRLHQLKVAGTVLPWAIGFSDGESVPTVDTAGNFELPTDRSFLSFNGYMANYPFDFEQNAFVQSSVGVQISGEPVLSSKST